MLRLRVTACHPWGGTPRRRSTYPPCHLSFRTAIRDYLWDGRGRRKERSMRRVGHLRWDLLVGSQGSLACWSIKRLGNEFPPARRQPWTPTSRPLATNCVAVNRLEDPPSQRLVGASRPLGM